MTKDDPPKTNVVVPAAAAKTVEFNDETLKRQAQQGERAGSAHGELVREKSSIQSLFTPGEREAVEKRLSDIKQSEHGLIRNAPRWDAVMVLCLLFTALVTPYEACYMPAAGFDALFFINRIVDFAFLLDMFVTCNTVFTGPDGQLVYNRKRIAERYFKGWFGIDFISLVPVPFDILSAVEASTTNVSDAVNGPPQVKLLRFSRLLRIIKLARVVRATRIIAKWETESGLSYSLMAVLKNCSVVLVLMHWGACLWYFAADLVDKDEQKWTTSIAENENREENEVSPHWFYLRSLFNSVSILYGGTCADGFSPRNSTEYAMAIILQSIGAACYAYALGGVCDYISNRDLASQAYRQSVDNMNHFLNAEKIPPKLKHRARTFFRHARSVIRARYYSDTLKIMSPHLRGEVVATMHHGWFQRVRFLHHSPDSERHTFITELGLALKLTMFAAMDRIMRPGELCKEMYIIYWGMCGLLGRVLKPGKVVGEDLILNLHHKDMRRQYSCTALTFVQAYRLQSAELVRILQGEDLVETRYHIRKAALRLCFCRTLIMVAQSKEKTEQYFQSEWRKDHDPSTYNPSALTKGPSTNLILPLTTKVAPVDNTSTKFVGAVQEISTIPNAITAFSELSKEQLLWLSQCTMQELGNRCA